MRNEPFDFTKIAFVWRNLTSKTFAWVLEILLLMHISL